MTTQPFSRRHGFRGDPPPITIRYEAPPELRFALVALAERGELSPEQVVRLFTQVLLVPPQGNWGSDWLRSEARDLLNRAQWYRVYDVAEAIYLRLAQRAQQEFVLPPPHEWFERELNAVFEEHGIGWQMVDGVVSFRGPAPLEEDIHRAITSLELTNRPTAAGQLSEARRDLSRRPSPDLTGAIQHALAALECLSRDLVGDPRATFGEILRRYPQLLPPPLNQAAATLWGYSSEFARHLREGREPTLPDTVFVVGVASAFAAYVIETDVAPSTHTPAQF